MEEAQNTIDGAQSFLDRAQAVWDKYTQLVGNIPGINGTLEDIVGGILIALLTAGIGFITYNVVSG